MRASVTVRVPGSTSNLGAGFDCVGVAVARWLRVTARAAPPATASGRRPAAPGKQVTIERRGTLTSLSMAPEHDLVYRGFVAACSAAQREAPPGLFLTADSDIPVARGLGSSAAAVVAGAGAATPLREPARAKELLAALGAELEGPRDNGAPGICGGANLVLREPGGSGGGAGG